MAGQTRYANIVPNNLGISGELAAQWEVSRTFQPVTVLSGGEVETNAWDLGRRGITQRYIAFHELIAALEPKG